MSRFTTSLDRVGLFITLGMIALTVLLVYWAAALEYSPTYGVAAIVLLLVIMISFGLSPKGYEVTDSCLRIQRIFGDRVIPRTAIQTVRPVDGHTVGPMIRAFGIGGLFGWVGKFWTKRFGFVSVYTRNRNHWILIDAGAHGRILISPDNEESREAITVALTPIHESR